MRVHCVQACCGALSTLHALLRCLFALQTSELLAANTKAVDEACQPTGEPPSVTGGTYAATYWVQLQQLLGRQMTRYWRMPQVGVARYKQLGAACMGVEV